MSSGVAEFMSSGYDNAELLTSPTLTLSLRTILLFPSFLYITTTFFSKIEVFSVMEPQVIKLLFLSSKT